ncbi:MAG: HEAT repeat domain-containing protein, partial [Acidobacteria bacterium]|nr:HEAT repeat domain-containing protein [Acidobacteriota bacterium]
TCHNLDIEIEAEDLRARLQQGCLLFVDGDQESDTLQRTRAFDALRRWTLANPRARVVMTLDEQAVREVPDALADGKREQVPVLLVQLLSPATVAQYLTSLEQDHSALLRSIQDANLFDLAGVPWLLAHLLRQSPRGTLSRSGVIARVVDGNLAGANLSGMSRRLVGDLLGRIAWTLQQRQSTRLDGQRLYELLDQVRGRRELPLEDFKTQALATRVLAPSHEDGVRFSYPGFQSYWCARYLLVTGPAFPHHLDDITATLGRRSRVLLWEDTLVLLAGMMDEPDRLIRLILAGSSMSQGEQTFLAARCISEAKLARRAVDDLTVTQVLDSLVWRSTPMKESSAAVRIRATECLALLKHPSSVPHLLSLAVERVRPNARGDAEFELSGLRHAALQVLLTMQAEGEEYLHARAAREQDAPRWKALTALMEIWRTRDVEALRQFYDATDVPGVRAIAAFALGSLGGTDNLAFLVERLLDARAADDTRWSITDSLLLFDPVAVTSTAVARMREVPLLHANAAYMIGRLRVATPQSEEWRFLQACLQTNEGRPRGMALRSLAQLGAGEYRVLCEHLARGAFEDVERDGRIAVPRRLESRYALQNYALQSLRLIGTDESIEALRHARAWRDGGPDRHTSQLDQLSYEVTEDIYWRLTGGFDGDLADTAESASPPR